MSSEESPDQSRHLFALMVGLFTASVWLMPYFSNEVLRSLMSPEHAFLGAGLMFAVSATIVEMHPTANNQTEVTSRAE